MWGTEQDRVPDTEVRGRPPAQILGALNLLMGHWLWVWACRMICHALWIPDSFPVFEISQVWPGAGSSIDKDGIRAAMTPGTLSESKPEAT